MQSISYQIRQKVKNLRGIEIVSVAIFGSVARQENGVDSDIDLLVVAEGVAKKRIQRIPDMIRIKRELDLGKDSRLKTLDSRLAVSFSCLGFCVLGLPVIRANP